MSDPKAASNYDSSSIKVLRGLEAGKVFVENKKSGLVL
jgi:hypothetical protein